MSAVQYMILAYAVYLIYSGFNNKKKLKNPDPMFPDENINVMFTTINKHLTILSSIAIVAALFITFALLITMTLNNTSIHFSDNYIVFLSVFMFVSCSLAIMDGGNFGIAGNLSGLKELIIEYYEIQKFQRQDKWEDRYDKKAEYWPSSAMKHNIKYLTSYYKQQIFGLYACYFSISIFISLHLMQIF